MSAIVEFLEYISNFIKSVADFILNYFKNLVKFFTSIPELIEILNSCIAWLPTYVIPFAMWFIAISVIFLIIRRN